MNRRQFLLASIAAVGVGVVVLNSKATRYHAEFDTLLTTLTQLKGQPLVSATDWNPSQVFQHLAQSVEGSLQGFQALKPAWFRATVGPIALMVFQARGKMSHPLEEPIPGAAALDAAVPTDVALERLIASLQALQRSTAVHPHFAYGELNLAQTMAAHQLHIEQHLTALTTA